MNHGLMMGMLWGGLLVAAVPTLLLIGVGVVILRHYRAERRREAAAGARAEEVST
ncbi:MAG TPA: hypothetical protein VMN60_13235 [Longimicrobiales bacterium]|nr:hypothetical protein [Longimicrobiales bacterium]